LDIRQKGERRRKHSKRKKTLPKTLNEASHLGWFESNRINRGNEEKQVRWGENCNCKKKRSNNQSNQCLRKAKRRWCRKKKGKGVEGKTLRETQQQGNRDRAQKRRKSRDYTSKEEGTSREIRPAQNSEKVQRDFTSRGGRS